MSLKFKPEDFKEYADAKDIQKELVTIAQQIFDKWLSEQPVVYMSTGAYDNDEWTEKLEDRFRKKKARLVCIEEIKKCYHPKEKVKSKYFYSEIAEGIVHECECGAKVQPKEFEEVK